MLEDSPLIEAIALWEELTGVAAVGMVERLRADIQAPIIDLRTS